MTSDENIAAILEIVRACDALQLCTCGATEYPETRHVSNAMNRDANDLTLMFMTGAKTPKAAQLRANPKCCLYYFNDANRHAVRLFGEIEFIADMALRRVHWRPEFAKFGYNGPDDPDFALMRFIPRKYKFYVASELKSGTL